MLETTTAAFDHRRHDFDRESPLPAQFAEQRYISGSPMPEPEIAAHENRLHGHRIQEKAPDKIFGADVCEFRVEAQHQHGINSGGVDRRESLFKRLEQGGGFGRPQNLRRMGVKGQHRRQRIRPASLIEYRVQNPLMA